MILCIPLSTRTFFCFTQPWRNLNISQRSWRWNALGLSLLMSCWMPFMVFWEDMSSIALILSDLASILLLKGRCFKNFLDAVQMCTLWDFASSCIFSIFQRFALNLYGDRSRFNSLPWYHPHRLQCCGLFVIWTRHQSFIGMLLIHLFFLNGVIMW